MIFSHSTFLLTVSLVTSSIGGCASSTPSDQVAPTQRFKFVKRADHASNNSIVSSPPKNDSSTDGSSSTWISSTMATEAPKSEATASSSSWESKMKKGGWNSSMSMSTELPTSTGEGWNATSTSSAISTLPTNASSPGGNAEIVVVLQLAFLLEVLEFEFYKAGLAKFGVDQFVAVGYSHEQAVIIIEQLQIIVLTEGAHVSIIEQTILSLGGQPFRGCELALEAALINPQTFLSVARTFEQVGIAAYSGAAHLVPEPQILTALATILSIESRHSALLNTLSGGSFTPQSFDVALSVPSVLALVGGFLQVCTPADLGLPTNEPLSVVEAQFGSTLFTIGSQLVFAVSIEIDITVLFCQMVIAGLPAALVLPAPACWIPEGIEGPVAVYLTNTSTPLATNIIIQNTVQIVAGPSLIFVDSQTTVLASLFTPASKAAPLYSVDMGGYWIAKRKGGEAWAKVQLMKAGNRTENVGAVDSMQHLRRDIPSEVSSSNDRLRRRSSPPSDDHSLRMKNQ
ncbi:hypothetical protein JCM5353_004167 [Sporobolomyces roseus]